jgi:hypothetical protein
MMTNSSASKPPQHPCEAFLRLLQMSRIQLFVFVEGDDDPFFYANLCQTALLGTGISYKIYKSKGIRSTYSGKEALIDLFNHLNNTQSLLNVVNEKKTCALFFLDKDVDDLCDRQIISEHIVYTYYYEVENHIVEHGNLNKGCSAAASIDPQEIDCHIEDQAAWLREAAARWKDWVKLCVFSSIKEIRSFINYGHRRSQINAPLTEEIDTKKYEEVLSLLRDKSGLCETEFMNEFEQISNIVEDIYEKGEPGKIFKGKWYAHFLATLIRQVAAIEHGDVDAIEKHIVKSIASTLDFDAPWADYFKQPLRKIIDKLNG